MATYEFAGMLAMFVFEIFYLYILNPESREKLRRIVFPISQIHAFPGQSTKWICLA